MNYQQLLTDSAVAKRVSESGGSSEDVAVALYEAHLELFKKFLDVDAIAPKKVIVNGACYVYRCPDDVIPITEA